MRPRAETQIDHVEIIEVVRKRCDESIEDFVMRIYERLKALKYSNIDIEVHIVRRVARS